MMELGELSTGLVMDVIRRTIFDDEGETGNVRVEASPWLFILALIKVPLIVRVKVALPLPTASCFEMKLGKVICI